MKTEVNNKIIANYTKNWNFADLARAKAEYDKFAKQFKSPASFHVWLANKIKSENFENERKRRYM